MSPPKPDKDAASDATTPKKAKAAARQERLAAQLRENLKKRKAVARSRKSADTDNI